MDDHTAETPDGDRVRVDRSAADRGSEGPFFVAHDVDTGGKYGYWCGGCGTLDTAMDTMGRIECNACGNVRKPDRWDAAHE